MDTTDELYQLVRPERISRLRQTIMGGPPTEGVRPGDCYRTTIACLLGFDAPDEVPHFVEKEIELERTGRDAGWEAYRLARLWLRLHHGIDMAHVDLDAIADLDIPYCLSIRSHRGAYLDAAQAAIDAVAAKETAAVPPPSLFDREPAGG